MNVSYRVMPKSIQWHVETEAKAAIQMKHETIHTTNNISFGKLDMIAELQCTLLVR